MFIINDEQVLAEAGQQASNDELSTIEQLVLDISKGDELGYPILDVNTVIVGGDVLSPAVQNTPTVIVVSEESTTDEAAQNSEDDEEDGDKVTLSMDATPAYVLIAIAVVAFLTIIAVVVYLVIRKSKNAKIQAIPTASVIKSIGKEEWSMAF